MEKKGTHVKNKNIFSGNIADKVSSFLSFLSSMLLIRFLYDKKKYTYIYTYIYVKN